MSELVPRTSTAGPPASARPLSAASYSTFAINTARILTLASIVYAAWRYGATDTLGLYHLSLSLGAAVILTLTCTQSFKSGSKRLPVLFLSLILIWVAYASLQQTTIAGWFAAPFGGVLHVQEHWGTEPIALLDEAIAGLQEPRPVVANGKSASVFPEQTRQAAIPFLLAGAAAILSALLFNTRQSRLLFLWTVIANATALAFWGIIQKSNGDHQILPGVENTFSSGMPFASFIYKNAGAAALLPALAATAAILYSRSGPRDRRGSSGGNHNYFGRKTSLLETKNLILISCAVLLTVGLAASLSRGAWLAAMLATIVVGLVTRASMLRREHLIVGSVCGLAILAVIAVVGIKQDIRGGANRVSLERFGRDMRWPQWVDGFSTAMVHFPAGSGLGTYGSSTLPHQSSTRRFWFREAHNQYLEVLTESGMIGVTILLIGIGWFTRVSWRLLHKRNDRERRSWGLFGLALLVCGGCQSAIDFVLVIPANLILYASLISIVGAVERTSAHRSKSPRRSRSNDGDLRAVSPVGAWRFSQVPAAWCGIAMVWLICAYRASSEQRFSEQSLASTSVTLFENQPSSETVSASIAALSAAVDQQPRQAALYRRRANWHLAAYRLELLRAAQREGAPIDWADTQPERLFGVLTSQDAQTRTALVTGLLSTPTMRSTLADSLSDLSVALSLDPLSPRGHLTGCVLSPLAGMPAKAWIASASGLVNNSSELLYMNGLFAFQIDEFDIAVDQWSKSLAINHAYLTPILELAQEKLPAIRVVAELVPPDRPELCVQLVRSTQRDPSTADGILYDQALAESIVRHLQINSSIESGRKHAAIAQIRQLIGDADAAVLEWEAAIKAHPREPSYRLEYSRALTRIGRHDDALNQAVLGQTLYPTDKRFEHLTAQIRREIRLGIHR